MVEIIILIVCIALALEALSWFIGGLYKNRCCICYRKRLARHTKLNTLPVGGDYICKPDCLTRSFLNGKLRPDGTIEYDYGELI